MTYHPRQRRVDPQYYYIVYPAYALKIPAAFEHWSDKYFHHVQRRLHRHTCPRFNPFEGDRSYPWTFAAQLEICRGRPMNFYGQMGQICECGQLLPIMRNIVGCRGRDRDDGPEMSWPQPP